MDEFVSGCKCIYFLFKFVDFCLTFQQEEIQWIETNFTLSVMLSGLAGWPHSLHS